MKSCITTIFGIIIFVFVVVISIQCIFLLIGPDYKQGEYTMTYKVYYSPNDTKTYTIKNNLPISSESYRGTNRIVKTTKIPYLDKMFSNQTVFESSAPIEVVSYTYKEKK